MSAAGDTQALGSVGRLISGQHIDAKDYNTVGRGMAYLTGPSDFGPVSPVVSKWTEHPKVTARSGDILITVKGSGVGKVNRLADAEVVISRQLMALRVTAADPHFVFYFLNWQFEDLSALATGAAIPGISREQVLSLQIPAMPLDEQQRIVAVLDGAFAGIAAARDNAERNLRNARALFESERDAIFHALSADGPERPLGAVSRSVSTGPFGSMLHLSDYVTGGTPIVNPINIVDGEIVPDAAKGIAPVTLERLQGYAMQAGDVVVGRRGEIGRCAVVDESQAGWVCGTGCFFVRPLPVLDPRFLVNLLRSAPYRERLEDVATGATMKNLSNQALAELAVAVPDLLEQRRVLTRLNALSVEVTRLAAIYTRKLAALDELKRSLLHHAFTGQLTTPRRAPAPTRTWGRPMSPTNRHAGILAMAYKRHADAGRTATFGHVKAEKIAHLVEAHLGIDLGRTPVKDAAGPNDFACRKQVDQDARRAAQFDFVREDAGNYRFVPLAGFDELVERTRYDLGPLAERVDYLVGLMLPMRTFAAEIFATTYAAWNNLLLDGRPVTDEAIVREAREDWHPEKLKIPHDRFVRAIAWMRAHDVTPAGRGERVTAKLPAGGRE